MLASFTSMQLESDPHRFGNPFRFNQFGKCSSLQEKHAKFSGLKGTSSPKLKAWIPALRAWDSQISAADMPKVERAVILYSNDDKHHVSKSFDDHYKTAKRLIESEYMDIARRGSDYDQVKV